MSHRGVLEEEEDDEPVGGNPEETDENEEDTRNGKHRCRKIGMHRVNVHQLLLRKFTFAARVRSRHAHIHEYRHHAFIYQKLLRPINIFQFTNE